jgi:hypothetical protein
VTLLGCSSRRMTPSRELPRRGWTGSGCSTFGVRLLGRPPFDHLCDYRHEWWDDSGPVPLAARRSRHPSPRSIGCVRPRRVPRCGSNLLPERCVARWSACLTRHLVPSRLVAFEAVKLRWRPEGLGPKAHSVGRRRLTSAGARLGGTYPLRPSGLLFAFGRRARIVCRKSWHSR